MKQHERIFSRNVITAVFTVFIWISNTDAAIYFKGKEVLRKTKATADVERIFWAPVKNSTTTDRIQVRLDVDRDVRVRSVMLVLQTFDTKNKPVSAFSMTPRKCNIHPCWGYCSDFYPFCGVRYSPRKPTDGFKKTECYKKGEIAWFYVDVPRDKNIQSMRIVNALVNDKEVPYNVRIVANRLKRSGLQPPVITHGTEAEFGDEDACRAWLPPIEEETKAQQTTEDVESTVRKENNTTPMVSYVRYASIGSPAHTDRSLLDVESLSKDWEDTGISSFKYRNRFKEFLKAVEEANEEAKSKRQELEEKLKSHLTAKMESAKSEEDSEVVKAITEALKSIGDGELAGDEAVIGKLRKSYRAHLEQIDKELFAAGLNAARVLHTSLDYQKQELKKKGDVKESTAVTTFQAKVVAWGKNLGKPGLRTDSGQGHGRIWTYTVLDNGFATIGNGTDVAVKPAPTGDLEIPGEIEGHPVVGIRNRAFLNYSELTSVTIPGSVRKVEEGAFAGCTGIRSVSVPLTLEIDVTQCGMIQAKFNSCNDFTSSIQESDTRANVSGVLMGYVYTTQESSRTYSDPIYGGCYNWNRRNTTFGYWGYMHMVAGRTYVFGKQFDDSVYIKVDGVVVLNNTIHTQFATGTYVPKTTGWHELEVRVADDHGEKGANGQKVAGASRRWSLTMGVGWRDDGVTTALPESEWHKLMDDGTASLLCTRMPAPCRISLLFPDSYSKIESVTILGVSKEEIPSTVFVGCSSLRTILCR